MSASSARNQQDHTCDCVSPFAHVQMQRSSRPNAKPFTAPSLQGMQLVLGSSEKSTENELTQLPCQKTSPDETS